MNENVINDPNSLTSASSPMGKGLLRVSGHLFVLEHVHPRGDMGVLGFADLPTDLIERAEKRAGVKLDWSIGGEFPWVASAPNGDQFKIGVATYDYVTTMPEARADRSDTSASE